MFLLLSTGCYRTLNHGLGNHLNRSVLNKPRTCWPLEVYSFILIQKRDLFWPVMPLHNSSELFYLIACQMGSTSQLHSSPTPYHLQNVNTHKLRKKDLLSCLGWSNSISICSVVISLEYLRCSHVLISTGSAWTSLPMEVDQTLSLVGLGLATRDYSPAVL